MLALTAAVGLLGILLSVLRTSVAQSDVVPELVIKPAGATVTKPMNEDIFLSCLLQPENAKGAVEAIRWLDRNSQIIGESTSGSDRIYTQAAPNGAPGKNLFIQALQTDDAGEYTCTADFPGHNALATKVTIIVFQDVSFDDAPLKQNPISGTEGRIKCEVSGNPPPMVDWLRDNTAIATGGRYKVDAGGLLISDISEQDDGEYTCRALVDETGRLSSRKIKVEVHSPPTFSEDGAPEDVRGIEEQSVSMKCVVTGRPTPDITWIFANNGEDVTKLHTDEQKTYRHTVDPFTGTMTINNLRKQDQGAYTCMTKNAAGDVSKSANVFVVEKPRFDVVSNVTVKEGETARIDCIVRGDPAPTLLYQKEGSLLPFVQGDDSRVTLGTNDRELSLSIANVNRDDDGLYVCTATNEAGTAEKSSHITVQFKPSFARTPMHVAKTWIENEEPVNLTCIAESIPNATIRWEKVLTPSPTGILAMPITETTQNMKVESRGPSSSLLISPKISEDFGEYVCIANNELGEARHIIKLFLASYPGPVTSVEFPVVTATTVTFNINGPNDPNNLDLDGYEVYYIEAGESFSNAMKRYFPIGVPYTVDNLQPGRRYLFRFHAKNRRGLGVESRDFEKTLPDIGPPRPPGVIPSSNDTVVEPHRYRLQWQEPEDNGARILDYQIMYWKDGEKGRVQNSVVAAPAGHYVLTGLDSSSRYNVEVTARNEKGYSPPMNMTFVTGYAQGVNSPKVDPADAGIQMSTGLIAGIACGALFLLALIIDIACYFTNQCGLTAIICRRFCGRTEKQKSHESDIERRHQDETELAPETEPLTKRTKITTTFTEKEPEDKPSPQ